MPHRTLRGYHDPLLVATLVLGALLAGCAQSGSGSTLTGNTWEWVASTTTSPASQSVVPVPQSYTIEFKPNQTFDGKADCNQISGTWTSTSGNGLNIALGSSTAAACGPDTLYQHVHRGPREDFPVRPPEEDKLITDPGRRRNDATFQVGDAGPASIGLS